MTNIQKRDFQKIIAVFTVGIVLILLIPMIFTGCSSKDIPALNEIKNYTEEDLENQLRGVSKEKLIEAWGEPIGTISETNACMWELDGESTITITFNSNNKMIDSGVGIKENNNADDLNSSACYGTVELPDNIFSILALCNNRLVYTELNSNRKTILHSFDLSTKQTVSISTLEDYQMNPANNAFLDNKLYLNYLTRNNSRKMICIDIATSKMDVLIEENNISGMVYSAATSKYIFSLKHLSNGHSVIERYDPSDKSFVEFLDSGTDITIHAISTYNEVLYVVSSDKSGNMSLIEYDCITGNTENSSQIPFVGNELIGYFQVIEGGFYITNFSGESKLFNFDGTEKSEYTDWSIATNTVGSFSHYSFFLRGNTLAPVIYDSHNDSMYSVDLEFPDNHNIRYVYTDVLEPQRLLVSFRNIDSGDEIFYVAGDGGYSE